jgi:hypothetical protein
MRRKNPELKSDQGRFTLKRDTARHCPESFQHRRLIRVLLVALKQAFTR